MRTHRLTQAPSAKPPRRRPPWGMAAIALVSAVAAIAAPTGSAIEGGSFPASTAETRATVSVNGGGCSGTLVAPDLVLSAGHCFRPHETLSPTAGHAPFNRDRRGWGDWERPDRWYPIGGTIDIGISGSDNRHSGTITEYTIPGNADAILLRLKEPVPRSAATPIPVMTQLPRHLTLNGPEWAASKTFTVAGFGGRGDGSADGRLREARVRTGAYPCPTERSGWSFGGDHKICTLGINGSAQPGDSGGPLYLISPNGRRTLVGITQGIESQPRSSRFTATFYRGGANYSNRDSAPLANIGNWLERHLRGERGYRASLRSTSATEDHYVSTMNPAGLDPRVKRLSTGVFRAEFPGLRSSSLHRKRVLIVSAFGATPGARYCKLGRTENSYAIVRCFNSRGTPAQSRFTLESIDPAVSGSAIVSHSPGGTPRVGTRSPFTVESVRPGLYRVALREAPRRPWKHAGATAAGEGSERCHVVNWRERDATVKCVQHDGSPAESGFHFYASFAEYESYVWNGNPRASFTRGLRGSSNVAGRGTALPEIRRLDQGRHEVTMNSVSSLAVGSLQASAHGTSRGHCGIEGTTRNRAVVTCFSADGRPTDLRFTLRHSDHLARGGWVRVRLVSARGIGSSTCSRDLNLSGTLRLERGATTRRTARISPTGVREFHRFGDSVAVASAVSPGNRYVFASLDLAAASRPSCGRFSRTVDLVPHPSVNRLLMRIDLLRHRVEVLDPKSSIQTGLGTFTVNGRNGRAVARVELAVDIPRPVASF